MNIIGTSNVWSELAFAIIRQAIIDYQKANDIETIEDCESFFLSQWYKELSSIDGQWLINKLKTTEVKL